MKKTLFFLPLFFLGCAISQSASNLKTEVTQFTKCYIHKIPAPFWVCYESAFMSVGKVYTQTPSRLYQQEAYAVGMKVLTNKILSKTKEFLKKLNYQDTSILEKVKSFVIMNAINDGSWYDKKDKILYVKVSIDKDEFKKYLFSLLKGFDKKVLEAAFNESF